MSFFQDQLRRAIARNSDSGLDWCITLESKQDPENWVQFTAQHVNMHYPLSDDPATALAELDWPVQCLDLDDWQAETYVTFSHGGEGTTTAVAGFVIEYVENILQQSAADANWSIDEYELS